MRIQIAENVKAVLIIKILGNKAVKPGQVLNITEEQFWSNEIQHYINKKQIASLDIEEKNALQKEREENLVEFKSISSAPFILSVLNKRINPNEVFYVPHDIVNTDQIINAIERRLIEVNVKSKIQKISKNKNEPQAEENSENIKGKKSKNNKNKEEQAVEKVFDNIKKKVSKKAKTVHDELIIDPDAFIEDSNEVAPPFIDLNPKKSKRLPNNQEHL